MRALLLIVLMFSMLTFAQDGSEKFDFFAFVSKLPEMLGYLSSALVAFIGLFALIPGEQPEAFLQKVVDVISKFSKK